MCFSLHLPLYYDMYNYKVAGMQLPILYSFLHLLPPQKRIDQLALCNMSLYVKLHSEYCAYYAVQNTDMLSDIYTEIQNKCMEM